jgi:hypothetical protein
VQTSRLQKPPEHGCEDHRLMHVTSHLPDSKTGITANSDCHLNSDSAFSGRALGPRCPLT